VGSLCPACGAASNPSADAICGWCGFALESAEADELRRMAGELEELDRQLYTLNQQRAALAVDLGNRRWTASRGARRADSPAPGHASHRPDSPEWTIDRVRSLLLWVGAALLGASALTFTTVAWTHLGNGGRAGLLAAVTALCVGGALGLRHRLPATAEAFTALSIALALIDWQALRRAGLTAGMSDVASWAIGLLIVSAFAFALGNAVGKRTARAAIALLLPLALELALGTIAGAEWAFALGFSLIAAATATAWRQLPTAFENTAARVALITHAFVTCWLGAIIAIVATVLADTFAQELIPAAIFLSLALAPVALLPSDTAHRNFARLANLVCALIAGAFVALAWSTFGPQGMLAWATIVGSVAVAAAPSLRRQWTKPAWVAGAAFVTPGLAYGAIAALNTIFGPLAWLDSAWQGSLATRARDVFAGPETATTWVAGGPAVVALVSSAVAIAAVAVATRHRRALIEAPRATGSVLAIAVAIACLTPVVAGASVGVACAVTTAITTALLLSGAALDRSRPLLARSVIPIAILPGMATTGWAATTSTASIVVLSVGLLVAVAATALAASDELRTALGALAGTTAVVLTGVATAAAGAHPATVGSAIAITGGAGILAGTHLRWRPAEGVALEIVGATAVVIGASIALQKPWWFAGTLTAIVPMLLVAALRKERAAAYSVAAGAAALAATWAWLGAANVRVVEAYTTPAAALAFGVGLLAWRDRTAGSWPAFGPAIVLGLGPILMVGIARDDNVRTVLAAQLAFAIISIGARKQHQSPLVLGTLALLTLAVDTFGPAIARLPRWLPLAVIGLLLMWIGATFETRRNRARHATETLLTFR
jgi:hypothetical protein